MPDFKSFTENPSLHLISLAAGLRSNGDPIEGNPFPKDDRRHPIWSDATRVAAEELCRVNLKFLKAPPSLNPEAFSPENLAAWKIAFTLERFNVWAARAIQVVWSDRAAEAFAQFLVDYAESWLNVHRESCPAFIRVESFLSDLRLGLIERVEYWKSEAFRYLKEQKVDAESVHVGANPLVDGGLASPQHVSQAWPSATDTGIQADRRAAVDSYIQGVLQQTGQKITRTDIWKSAGYKTRTEFERWQRGDSRTTKAAHRNFTRILTRT
jgi:hypothetical protein